MKILAYKKLGDKHYEIFIESDIESMSEYYLNRMKSKSVNVMEKQ